MRQDSMLAPPINNTATWNVSDLHASLMKIMLRERERMENNNISSLSDVPNITLDVFIMLNHNHRKILNSYEALQLWWERVMSWMLFLPTLLPSSCQCTHLPATANSLQPPSQEIDDTPLPETPGNDWMGSHYKTLTPCLKVKPPIRCGFLFFFFFN